MLIILEGADGAGKSTLADEVYWRFTAPRLAKLHAGPPKTRSLITEYLLPLADYDPRDCDIVLDRWHLGELVYPALTGRESLVTPESLTYLELFFRSRGALVVAVAAGVGDILNRREARGETASEGAVKHECGRFADAFIRSNLPVVTVSTSGGLLTAESAELVISAARQVADVGARLAPFRTYVGTSRPDVLLVGDERGPTDLRYPTAFIPLPATSGHYLFTALRDTWLLETGYGEARAGVVNVNEDDDIAALWEALGRPSVVALGARAAAGAKRAGLSNFGTVPHPQFCRRFLNKHSREYGRIIEETAQTGDNNLRWRPSGSWCKAR